MTDKSEPLLVGVSGVSGSGKTFLTDALKATFQENLSVISFDNYYKNHSLQTRDNNGYINFDLPEALESELFAIHLLNLIEGHPVIQKKYLFETRDAPEETLIISPAQVIVVEGLFVFHYPEVDKLLDMRIFVDTDLTLSLQRRLRRDSRSRGIGEAKSLYQWHNHVMPSFEKFIQPHMHRCDLILDGEVEVGENVTLITSAVNRLLNLRSFGGR